MFSSNVRCLRAKELLRRHFFVSNHPHPFNLRHHLTLKCVLDVNADYPSRRAKGRGTKCNDAAESSIRGLEDLGLFFSTEARSRAATPHSYGLDANNGKGRLALALGGQGGRN